MHLFTAQKGGEKNISQKEWITNEIKKAKQKGISVFVEGTPCSDEKLEAPWFVQEEVPYMIDFESDDKGRIVQMNFSKISQF